MNRKVSVNKMTLKGLKEGKTYYVRIRGRRGKDKSTGNLTKSVTIPAAQPPL